MFAIGPVILDPRTGQNIHSTIIWLIAAILKDLHVSLNLGLRNHIILEAGRDHIYKHGSEHMW